MKTVIQIVIDHTEPLPDKTPLTDVIAQRTYNYLYSQGAQVGVTATVGLALEVRDME